MWVSSKKWSSFTWEAKLVENLFNPALRGHYYFDGRGFVIPSTSPRQIVPRTAFRLASWTGRTPLRSRFCNSYLGVHRWHLPYCKREGSVDLLLPEGFVIQSWNFYTRPTRAASFRSSLTGNASSGPTQAELSGVSSPLVSSHTAWLLWTPTSADAGRARRVVFFTSTRARAARIGWRVLFWVCSCVLYGDSLTWVWHYDLRSTRGAGSSSHVCGRCLVVQFEVPHLIPFVISIWSVCHMYFTSELPSTIRNEPHGIFSSATPVVIVLSANTID